jgi:DNA repair protein RecN (Recombination protein N)
MLTHLVIRNFAIIEHLEIPFNQGFTVLTGETGAGKSIIIDALNLILGGRATADVIRTDADEAVVEAIFELGDILRNRITAWLDTQGIESARELIIRRIVSRSGRNKVFVNGSLTTVSALAELTRGLVDISGQHEHYSLLRADEHIDLLDAFAVLKPEVDAMSAAFDDVSSHRRALKELKENVRERLHRIDFLRFQLQEIDAAKLVAGEEQSLAEELTTLQNAEKIVDAVEGAARLTYEQDGSAVEILGQAVALLEKSAAFHAPLDPLATRLEEARIIAEEVARDLSHITGSLELDPRRLDTLIERQETIKKLRRKHGGSVEEILENAAQMRAELHGLENAEERGQEIEQALAKAERHAFKLAADLSRSRRKAALELTRRIEAELTDLNMARTTFLVDFQPAEIPASLESDSVEKLRLSSRGFDRVEFLLAPNAGEAPKPLSKIASGGELSRIMLAIKSVLMERDTIETYVFDEVDTGIGGSTADVVGEKIRKTADGHQVLCITHLPQIASRSDHHYMVEKLLVDGRTQSTIRPLSTEERVEEIARMLGGARVTARTLDAARELLGAR